MRTGKLSTGDRIVQVGDTDIESADQDKAVQSIAMAGNPIRLIVQSLLHYKVLGSRPVYECTVCVRDSEY